MKILFNIKNKIEETAQKHPFTVGYLFRLLLCFCALIVMRGNIGFNGILSHILFVLVFAVVCAFLPIKLLLLTICAYLAVQIFSLSTGVGVVTCIFLIISYLLYYRFDENTGYVIILIPLLYLIKLPALIPLVLAVSAPAGTLVSVLIGFIMSFYLHYLSVNAVVIQGMTDVGEIDKMSVVLSRLFTNNELWLTLLSVAIVFIVVYFLKKINVNKSNVMAISIGAGLYMILILVSNLLLNSMTYNKLIWIVAGTVISWILALLISSVILPLDYNRTELMEFEDDEYKYFVRAVPKVSVSRETVKIKRIYSRRQVSPSKDREEHS